MPRPRKPRIPGPPAGGGYQPGQAPGGGGTQPVRVPTGLPYGENQQLAQSQQQIPLPAAPGPPSAGPPATAGQPSGLAQILAAAAQTAPPAGSLTAPTQRPNEPVTAGVASGPGPGPEANQMIPGASDQILANLYRAYQIAPTEGLRALIAQVEQAHGPAGPP